MLEMYLQDESGATAIEYGLIAALISIALIGGARLIGVNLNSIFATASTEVSNAGNDYIGN